MLNLTDLVVQRGGKTVLHGVSLQIAPGEITALVGANGAGKSTLVMALARALPIVSGRIELDGAALHGRRPPRRFVPPGWPSCLRGIACWATLGARQPARCCLRVAGKQFTSVALAVSQQAYGLERGRATFGGAARTLREQPEILHSSNLAT